MRSRDHGRPWRGLHCGGPAFRWTALVAIVIGALVTFAYRHTGGAPFLLDDGPSILDNPGVAGGPWSAAAWTPPPWSFTAGRPVLNWSFAASAGLCGMDAACFRRANVALHALNAVLLFLLVVEALRAAGISARLRVSPAVVGAACAVVWAVNPLHTAAVTYVSQRAEVLMGTFLLGTVLCFLRGLLSGRPALWRTLAAAAFAAGVMTKETVVSAPLVCLLLERAAGRGRGRGLRRGDWRDYAGFAPGLLLFAMLAASSALASRLAVAEGGWIGADTFVLQLRAIGEYALLCLWPHPLVFDRGTSGLALAAYPVWSGVMVLLLAAAGVRAFLRGRRAGMPLLLFLLLLAPTTSLVPVLGQPIADHRLYLPLAAFVAGASVALFLFLPRGAPWLLAALAAPLLALTVARNADYRTEESIWADTVSKAPLNHRAHGSLGRVLLADPGRRDEGMRHLREALRLEPDDAETHYQLGLALLTDGARDEAGAHFRRSASLAPGHALAHAQVALLLLEGGHSGEALPFARRAVALRGERVDFRLLLGAALRGTPGGLGESRGVLEAVAAGSPGTAEAWLQLGLTLAVTPGDRPHAIEALIRATRLDPGSELGWRALASLLVLFAGREDEARVAAERADALGGGRR